MKLSFGTGLKFDVAAKERAEKLLKSVKQSTKPSEFISIQGSNTQNVPNYREITPVQEEAYLKENGFDLEDYDAGITVKSFKELEERYKAPKELVQNIAKQGWLTPSYCQQCSIPVMMSSVNSVCQAPTGSGKTGAYLLPIIMRAAQKQGQYFHILEPTEELCVQVSNLVRQLTSGLEPWVLESIWIQLPQQFVRQLADPEVKGMQHVLILDECDMLIKKHEKRVQQILEALAVGSHRPELHLFSASISAEVSYIASTFLGRPTKIRIRQPYQNITHRFAFVSDVHHKVFMLKQHVLQQPPPILVFCAEPEALLKALNWSIPSAVLHDRLPLTEKQSLLQAFEQQKIWCLLATDSVARGVDFKGLQLVVQFDAPKTTEDYIHRCGRAGRQFKGKSLCFFQAENRPVLDKVVKILNEGDAQVQGYSTQAEVDAHKKELVPRKSKKLPTRENEGKMITDENIDDELYAEMSDEGADE